MTNLDYVTEGVYMDDVKEQLDELIYGLQVLDRELPNQPKEQPTKEKTVTIPARTIWLILTAWRKLTD